MKIFIIGYSRSGKTTLAELMAKELGVKYCSASGWLHQMFDVMALCAKDETKQEYIERLTALSLDTLQTDPDVCIRYVRKSQATIIEGIRNPRDFLELFDPITDVVIYCNRYDVQDAATNFEADGLSAIKQIFKFQQLIYPGLEMIYVNHSGPPDGLESELEEVLTKIGATKKWRL